MHIPLSIEGMVLSGSALRGIKPDARVASLHPARVEGGHRKKHTHNAQNAENAHHRVPEEELESYFWHAQNA